MAGLFWDTSALVKHYHPELGTPKVDNLLQRPESQHLISRLAVTETFSVFAGKVRAGLIIWVSNFGDRGCTMQHVHAAELGCAVRRPIIHAGANYSCPVPVHAGKRP